MRVRPQASACRASRAAPCLALLALLVAGCSGDAPPARTDTFAFAVFGDGPYYGSQFSRFRSLLEDVDREDLAWFLHVGDALWYPCTDTALVASRRALERQRHPIIYTPGDNEWTDCWEERAGGFAPLERLATLREIYFPVPTQSLGARPFPVATQGRTIAHAEFIENVRWVSHGVVFATIHLVGSRNGWNDFPGRTAAEDREVVRRTAAAISWLRDAFAAAATQDAKAVVIASHANPWLEYPPDDLGYFREYMQVLETEVTAFARPVVYVHGETHTQRIDHPLRSSRDGRPLEHLTRVETFGSPHIGWVRIVVDTSSSRVFRFQANRIRRWWDIL